jgi:CelD/BcsL family acetyltransferase involved in cellulose biosynthesis
MFAESAGWSSGIWKAAPSPIIKLDCSYETVLSRLKGKDRYNLRRRQAKLAETGRVELEVVTDRERVAEVMKDGLRIEAAAWKGEHGTAMRCDPAVEQFYVRLAERAADLGWLRICFLVVNGKRIAFDYTLEKDQTIYAIKIGYDPEYHTYSPGHLLLLEILAKACEQGCKAYDFLGADDEWKFMWTKEVRNHDWLFLFPNRPLPLALRFAKFELLPRIRKLKKKRS